MTIEKEGSFWKSLDRFRQALDAEGIWVESEVFEGVREARVA